MAYNEQIDDEEIQEAQEALEYAIYRFNIGTGFDADVNSIAVQADGKFVVAGSFSTYQGIPAQKIVRLNTDGSIDPSFIYGTGFNSPVNKVLIQPDGKILAVGLFSLYKGVLASQIVRINIDGSIDGTFVSGTGFNSIGSYSIALQADGKILVGGGWASYNGTAANRIIRLNVNGNVDGTFVYGTGFNAGNITAIAVQADGKIIVGGNSFASYNGTTASRIIRLNADGSIDGTFVYGTGLNQSLNAIAIQVDGKILIGGNFTSYNGTTGLNRITRLNTTGSIDTNFYSGTGFSSTVNAITIQSDGNILVGGSFATFNAVSIGTGIARLKTSGVIDDTFLPGTGTQTTSGSAAVQTVVIAPSGEIIIGGLFTRYGGYTYNRIVLLTPNGGSVTTTVGPFFVDTGTVQAIGGIKTFTNDVFVRPDSGGVFSWFGKLSAPAKNDIFGILYMPSSYTSFGAGFAHTTRTIAIQADGKPVVGGDFVTYNGGSYNRIVRFTAASGIVDTTFVTGTGFDNRTNFILVDSGGKIVVGGRFASYNGTPAIRIIRINTDGSADGTFVSGTGFDNDVTRIVQQLDGKYLMIGTFTAYNGTPANRIIRLNTDGSVDGTFVYGTGFDNTTSVILLQPDGKIIVSGSFTSYNGTAANRIIRLNANGSVDGTFVYGTGFNATADLGALQANGRILLTGDFISYNGTAANRIIRLNTDGTVDSSFVYGTGFTNKPFSIAIQSTGKIVIGGNSLNYNGVIYTPIFRLHPDGTPDASFISHGGGGDIVVITIDSGGNMLLGGEFNISGFYGTVDVRITRYGANGPIFTPALVALTGTQTINGSKTFIINPKIPDEAYGAPWVGKLEPPTKSAVYAEMETKQDIALNILVDSGMSLMLGGANIYVFNGTTSTWALPVGGPAFAGLLYRLKNRGSGVLTLIVIDNSATIYEAAGVTSTNILPGESRTVIWDGTFWSILN